jgi:hypothetical protein
MVQVLGISLLPQRPSLNLRVIHRRLVEEIVTLGLVKFQPRTGQAQWSSSGIAVLFL